MKQHPSATAFARLISEERKNVTSWIGKEMLPNVQPAGDIYRVPHEALEETQAHGSIPINGSMV